MRKNGNVSKLPGGIYPGESLWSIVNRFVWLNRTTLKETTSFFEEVLEKKSLFYLNRLNSQKYGDRLISEEALKSISLTRRQLKMAVLPSFIRSISALRFCHDCARQGFHATIFQVPIFEICPAHGTPLESRCPSCGYVINSIINNYAVKHPYACERCGVALVESRRTFFLADKPPGIDRIIKASRWLNSLEMLTMGWGDFPSFEWSNRSYHGVDNKRLILALASATGLGIGLGLGAKFSTDELRNVSTLAFNAMEISNTALGIKYERPFVIDREAIYKSFLRHKTGQLRATLSRKGGVCTVERTPVDEICRVYPDLMRLVLSMLFFRAHCECWRADKEFNDPIRVARFRRIHGKISNYKNYLRPSPGSHVGGISEPHFESSRLPDAVKAWAEGQLFTQKLSWIWREASEYASEMVRRGRILRRPRLRGIYMPQFFTLTRGQESSVYRLDFWSGRKNLVRPDFASAWYTAAEAREEQYFAAVFAALDRA